MNSSNVLFVRTSLALTAFLCTAADAQTTYYVNESCGNDAWTGTSAVCVAPDGPKRTIQVGINASVTGDTVILSDGIYTGSGNRDLDFGGRDIRLHSESLDPNLCIIDCQGSGRGFYFNNAESANAIVEGIAVQNGLSGFGGGALCIDASPTFRNCVFENNEAFGERFADGGGVSVRGGSPSFLGCAFIDNQTGTVFVLKGGTGVGGGLYVSEASVLVRDCVFFGNRALAGDHGYSYGGGIYVRSGTVEISNCSFVQNDAHGNLLGVGGALAYRSASTVHIVECAFEGNSAGSASGGSAGAVWGAGLYERCVFTNNTSGFGGTVSDGTFLNCLFMENHAEKWASVGQGVFTACTFVGNTVPSMGGVLSESTIDNCVFWDNSPDPIYEPISVSYSLVQGGYPGPGNIQGDPLFVDPIAGDYRLSAGSPAIDAGDNTALPAGVTTDLDGNPRFVDDSNTPNTGVPGNGFAEIVDMGAYEFQGEVCYADCDQSTGNGVLDVFDFLCWQNSFVHGEPYACDCDTSTGPLVCDLFDFLCFQDAFVAGCP